MLEEGEAGGAKGGVVVGEGADGEAGEQAEGAVEDGDEGTGDEAAVEVGRNGEFGDDPDCRGGEGGAKAGG